MRCPSWIPGGISTSIVRSSVTRPAPLHSAQGVGITSPVPPHSGQPCVRTNWPKTEDETDCSRPAPPQRGQVSGSVPGSAPEPAQAAQGSDDREGHGLRRPLRRLDELELDLGEDVPAAAGPPARSAGAEDVLAEEDREDVAEAREVEVGRPEPAGPQALVAEAVVELARLRLREHLVGLGGLPEALLGVRVLGDVGVQLAREPPERLLDLALVAPRATPRIS